MELGIKATNNKQGEFTYRVIKLGLPGYDNRRATDLQCTSLIGNIF